MPIFFQTPSRPLETVFFSEHENKKMEIEIIVSKFFIVVCLIYCFIINYEDKNNKSKFSELILVILFI